MRDINVTKYRKLLYPLQYFCSNAKRNIKWDARTDFELGFINGKHAAYNEMLRELHKAVEYADIDWEHIHCREENNTWNFAFKGELWKEF